MEHMRQLHQDHGQTYQTFIICDAPESPTWPFSHSETQEILSWPKFAAIGPIYRRPHPRTISTVRERYRIGPGDKVLVFSLGGGGEQHGSDDRVHFVSKAESIAKSFRALHRNARFLFVCGPLFPNTLHIPDWFERIAEEPELPSLLACSSGAVIRPGYNTLWECIACGTPFLPVLGTGYMEPFAARLEAMRAFGLPIPRTVEDLADDQLPARFKSQCDIVTRRFPGTPAKSFIEILSVVAPKVEPDTPGNCTISVTHRNTRERRQLHADSRPEYLNIRIDRVTRFDKGLHWLMGLLCEHNIYASLEIVPYMSQLGRQQLENLDRDCRYEVSMYGFCGLPANGLARWPQEFNEGSTDDLVVQQTRLKQGFRIMRYLYRERFRGGLALPVGAMPEWIPPFWETIGGRYISKPGDVLWSTSDTVTQVVCTEVNDSFRPRALILDEVTALLERDGVAGLSFSSRTLSNSVRRTVIRKILGEVLASRPHLSGCHISDACRLKKAALGKD
jgi:hypothetical protein